MRAAERAAAKANGEKWYFTGKPCKNGHIEKRLVSNSACFACAMVRIQAWRDKNSDHIVAYGVLYRNENQDAIRNRRMKTYWENPEIFIQKSIDWSKRNPKKNAAKTAARRTKKAGGSGTHTMEEVNDLLIKQKFKCAMCKRSVQKRRHVDHIMPLSLGGSNEIRNIQILCPSCNLKKSAKHPTIFAQELGFLI